MNAQACAGCGAAVENPAVTGIFCEACYARNVAPSSGWKSFFTGPTYVGLIAVAIPLFLHITVNNLDYIALAGAIVGILAALAGAVTALKAAKPERLKKLAPVAIVLVVALLDLRSSGIL
jgi:hypothetical protein